MVLVLNLMAYVAFIVAWLAESNTPRSARVLVGAGIVALITMEVANRDSIGWAAMIGGIIWTRWDRAWERS